MRALQDSKYKPSDIEEVVLVGGMTRVPRVQAMVKEIFGKEGHKGVNPDEVVAVGAAIQGAQLLLGSKSEVLLLDVTPLSLGIGTLGGVMTKLIERNTTIPAVKKQVFSTAEDNQPAVTIRVFQGEREMAADNRLLGQFNLEDIPLAPRGMPQIEVAFDIDANGILHVSAKDKGTGREQKITIQAGTGLSPEEIEKMKKDAESFAEEDSKRREEVEVRNQADSLAYTAEKTVRESGEKIPADVRADIEGRIKDVRDALSSDSSSAETIRNAMTALSEALQRAGSAMFGQPGDGAAEGAPPEGEGEAPAEEGTVEGEYREV